MDISGFRFFVGVLSTDDYLPESTSLGTEVVFSFIGLKKTLKLHPFLICLKTFLIVIQRDMSCMVRWQYGLY